MACDARVTFILAGFRRRTDLFSDVSGFRRLLGAAAVATVAWASPCAAQVTPAAGYAPPDDTPSIRVGATIFADYTYQDKPEVKDADGNSVHLSSFNVGRSYINVTGKSTTTLPSGSRPTSRERRTPAAPLTAATPSG